MGIIFNEIVINNQFLRMVLFKSRLSLIVRVNVVLNRTVVVVDSDCQSRFDNLCGIHLRR